MDLVVGGDVGGVVALKPSDGLSEGQVEVVIRDSGTWRGSSRGDRGNGLRLMRGLMDTVLVDTSRLDRVLAFDPEAANLMFSLVSARYERASKTDALTDRAVSHTRPFHRVVVAGNPGPAVV